VVIVEGWAFCCYGKFLCLKDIGATGEMFYSYVGNLVPPSLSAFVLLHAP
jgi:hypothetical protein